ncbi:hypothetical protein [Pectobacterium peruviense]|uniref:hypothetical protein n=1 Tax=Pectobacterium peruviense TaxID=2066479 RepID=UPI000AFDFBEF|nr:hypothetical protein [Pectobacterium peruviense]
MNKLPVPVGLVAYRDIEHLATLANKGIYLASKSTFYRVLCHHGEVHHSSHHIK